ncbi:hypothetical protein ACYEXS_35290 [Paenibacillus sp. MAH-36]|uniref:Uncharacterized protein n=1 Tax=Paenibacillus violae TaxID=3077234 RepID=A0ABU3RI73_9BACL|nr:hypothetical protein [Paenibacillus sp. PFR10]MDU0203985.1 hypothetical protein [Paenibacillus sp. PFR10]
MEIFPDKHELIGLFECEPQFLDEIDIPEYYNQWRFILKRRTDVLEIEIEPSNCFIHIRWHQENNVLVELTLEKVYGIEIKKQGASEFAQLLFRDKNLKILTLRTKPYISICWGTEW